MLRDRTVLVGILLYALRFLRGAVAVVKPMVMLIGYHADGFRVGCSTEVRLIQR
jgi:hypothetical protein